MNPETDTPPVLLDEPSRLRHVWQKIKNFRNLSRPKQAAIVLVVLALFSGGGWLIFHSKPSPVASQNIAQAPTTVASPLTGLQVEPALADRPVTAVMIENSTDARPQSGLDQAGVVFEAVAEGGITRFAAFYQEAQPQYIGPVRSLRTYYLDWADGFQASIAHVGGAPDALQRVRSAGQRDLDEFFNAGSYWRINSRLAPHNVYTSFAKLDALNKSKGYTHSDFTPWTRKTDSPSTTPTAKTINLTLSGYYYDVSYMYDTKTNTYYRYEGGQKHTELTVKGTQVWLHPKVVIAMVVPLSNGKLDSSDAYYSNYADIGSGRAVIFQDGTVTNAIWKKNSASSPLQFLDANNNPFPLNTGQVWITAVSAKTAVSYSAK